MINKNLQLKKLKRPNVQMLKQYENTYMYLNNPDNMVVCNPGGAG